MRFVLLSLVLLMSLIHQYNCLPSWNAVPKKDSNVEIKDEVSRLISLLEKETNTDDRTRENERLAGQPLQATAEDRSAYFNYGPQCGSPAYQPELSRRIVGGKVARAHSWPWQCYLQMRYDPRSARYDKFCGGSVISNTHILTAAHCFYDEKSGAQYRDVKVFCGLHDTHNLKAPTVQMRTGEAKIHEKYLDANQRNNHYLFFGFHDIAVVRLYKPLIFNNFVSPVCLPYGTTPSQLDVGTGCVITGFGKTKNAVQSRFLKQAVVPVENYDKCKNLYQKAGIIFPNHVICLGPLSGGESACFGDSGGPMIVKQYGRWRIYGVFGLLWSPDPNICARQNKPYAATSVVDYLPWIKGHITDNDYYNDYYDARMDSESVAEDVPSIEFDDETNWMFEGKVPFEGNVHRPVETNERKNDVENPWLDPLYRRLSDQKPLAGED